MNYDVFLSLLPTLLRSHQGEYVVMRDGETVLFEKSRPQAYRQAMSRFPDGLFSIQHCVNRKPIDLM